MKKYLFILLTAIFFLSCNNEGQVNAVAEDGFESDLQGLYSELNGFFGRTATRAGEAIPPEDQDAVLAEATALEELICGIAEKYDVAGEVERSEYYKGISEGDIRNVDFDFYDHLHFLEENGTEEFFDIITKWLVYEDVDTDIAVIVGNEKLLPNEKISLVACHAWICSSQIVTRNNEAIQKCKLQLRRELADCDRVSSSGFLTSVVLVFVSGGPTAVGYLVGVIQNDYACKQNANVHYNNCINEIKLG